MGAPPHFTSHYIAIVLMATAIKIKLLTAIDFRPEKTYTKVFIAVIVIVILRIS